MNAAEFIAKNIGGIVLDRAILTKESYFTLINCNTSDNHVITAGDKLNKLLKYKSFQSINNVTLLDEVIAIDDYYNFERTYHFEYSTKNLQREIISNITDKVHITHKNFLKYYNDTLIYRYSHVKLNFNYHFSHAKLTSITENINSLYDNILQMNFETVELIMRDYMIILVVDNKLRITVTNYKTIDSNEILRLSKLILQLLETYKRYSNKLIHPLLSHITINLLNHSYESYANTEITRIDEKFIEIFNNIFEFAPIMLNTYYGVINGFTEAFYDILFKKSINSEIHREIIEKAISKISNIFNNSKIPELNEVELYNIGRRIFDETVINLVF